MGVCVGLVGRAQEVFVHTSKYIYERPCVRPQQ